MSLCYVVISWSHDYNLLLPSKVLYGSVFRAIYVLLSVHFRGLIKIFWYVRKMRGQVNKILSKYLRCLGSLALAVEIECRRLCMSKIVFKLIRSCAHCYFVKCLYLHMEGHGRFSWKSRGTVEAVCFHEFIGG